MSQGLAGDESIVSVLDVRSCERCMAGPKAQYLVKIAAARDVP
jgi:hypothetical protein